MVSSSEARDRAHASEAARLLLDRAGLATYLLELHRDGDAWRIEVEHPRDRAWHRVTLRAAHEELVRTLDDRPRRLTLASEWGARIAGRDAA